MREQRIDELSTADRYLFSSVCFVLIAVGLALSAPVLAQIAGWFAFHWTTIWQVAVLWCLVARVAK